MSYNFDRLRVLVVDDNQHMRTLVSAILQAFGVTTVFDAAGNVIRTVDALGNAVTATYDNLNRRVTVQDTGGGIATTVYDADSNVVNTIVGGSWALAVYSNGTFEGVVYGSVPDGTVIPALSAIHWADLPTTRVFRVLLGRIATASSCRFSCSERT